MTSLLPDVALNERPSILLPLDWVGMQHIDLLLHVDEPGVQGPIHAVAGIQVDLPDASTKGIHMSRLYQLLDDFAQNQTLTPYALARLLEQTVQSHADCQSRGARLHLAFNLVCRRVALLTKGLSGWKSYPVEVEAIWHDGRLVVNAHVGVTYSSTCPCSAALSRQLVQEAFLKDFGHQDSTSPTAVADWLKINASAATPHSQRSVASIKVAIDATALKIGLMRIVDLAEDALGTPVQTAVKRVDEQEFAKLNGQNLMYVEDASRRVLQALWADYPSAEVFVSHFESLHPHDAVAWGHVATGSPRP